MNGEFNIYFGLNELLYYVFQVKSYSIYYGYYGYQIVMYGFCFEFVKIVIVLIDGWFFEFDQIIRVVYQFYKMGVEVFVIGMGYWVDGVELNQIVIDGDYVYKILLINDLVLIYINIVDVICKCMLNWFCSCIFFFVEIYIELYINGFKINQFYWGKCFICVNNFIKLLYV